MRSLLSLLFLLLWAQINLAQTLDELTVEKIMRDPSWIGNSPEDFYWGDDSQKIYFEWNPENNPSDSLYQFEIGNSEVQKVSNDYKQKIPRYATYNADRSKKIWTRSGKIFVKNIASGKTHKILESPKNIDDISFSENDEFIFYRIEEDVFSFNTSNGYQKHLLHFTNQNPDKKAGNPSDQEQWLIDQQEQLIEVIQKNKSESKQREDYLANQPEDKTPEIYTEGNRLLETALTPNGKYVIYRLYVSPAGSKNTQVPNFVTETGYIDNLNARQKVGAPQGFVKLGVYDLENKVNNWVETKSIEGINQIPKYWKEDYPERSEESFEERKIIFQSPLISSDSKYIVLDARADDNKDRWLFLLNPTDASLSLINRQRDEAWIAGPGIGWTWGGANKGFLNDQSTLYFQSEASGYSHLYTVDLSRKKRKLKQLTSGNFEIYDVQKSRDGKYFYFTANPNDPGIRNLYRVETTGGKMEPLTDLEGGMDYELSPDESKIALRLSTSNTPWDLYWMNNEQDAPIQRITNSLSDEFKSYDWRKPEFITFKASDGAEVHARLYKGSEGTKDQPAVIFVHGAGYLQNAHHWWSSYFREYMFHNLLADQGYTVLDIDYRGSAGYGRDWRTAIYRHMGGKDLSDQVDGAQYLKNELGVDPENIGIYGGSYGGFITLMALFNEAETFASGAALRSVTDWAHYNHGYTSNILNTPVNDPIAYERSSPIYFAEGLEDPLLICHGMVDTNVQFQDVVRLSQRLIELGKEDWEMAVYPVEGHGFVEPSSWTDEYSRIYKLFKATLKD